MSAAAATQGIQRSGSGSGSRSPPPPLPASECDAKHRPCVVGLLFPPHLIWVKSTTRTVLKLKYFTTKKHKDVWEWRKGRPMEALTSTKGPAKGKPMSLWSTDQNHPRQKNPDRSSRGKHHEVKQELRTATAWTEILVQKPGNSRFVDRSRISVCKSTVQLSLAHYKV